MWQIIGSGAIGCLWAANLLKTGQQVHLVSRTKMLTTALQYQNLQGHKEVYACSNSTTLVKQNGPILVCVKAPQVKQALLQQRKNISDDHVIILMHNGMGSAEQVAEVFPNNPIICATTANASLVNGPLNITQTGLGITYLGAFNRPAQRYSDLAMTLNNALGNSHWCEDIQQKLWLKLIINIAINPLTAIHQVNNGKLIHAPFQEQIKTIIDEAMPVLDELKLEFGRDELLQTINKVINATAVNYSSMNRDIHFQRATENDYISGYLIKKASQYNIETPFITSLYEQVKVLESRSLIQ
ncbi:2-dehydropantoate 2-reductase [Psychromonas marina]|uniref:2-dehydropantoate 2-reductase n=1 Tax=Psychromonas marina TaxID=88364 RepID=A0ABQ6E248_9GAMM|nr:2-dehydropantoate 2-reductase [Psychromonas marina]GLS91390.1 2-dehydropantoate 2-reductase [Psychromonas marina]